jgi:hypothetical protein
MQGINAIEVGLLLVLDLSIFPENSGEKFQFLREGNVVTKSSGSVYQGS